MINSWSLLYDELYGDDEMNTSDFTVGVSTESFGDNSYYIDPGDIDNITIDTSNYDTWSGITLEAVPAFIIVTETTAELVGSMFLDTKVCNPEIIDAATGTGSFAN